LAEHVQRGEYEGVVFADGRPLLRDDGQPIGVHVLSEPDVGTVLFDCGAEVSEIFRQRLGGAGKLTIGLIVDCEYFGTQRFQ
jgi:hypothetical protein